jgi:hypothetical protein
LLAEQSAGAATDAEIEAEQAPEADQPESDAGKEG